MAPAMPRSLIPALLTLAVLSGALSGLPAPGRAADTAPPVVSNPPDPAGVEFFEKRVRPLLVRHCYECHSADAKKVKGELLLDSRAAVLKGGRSGPALVPGKPDQSLLIKAVRYHDEELRMPPAAPLKAEEIADLEAWVRMGAPDPRTGTTVTKVDPAAARGFWSFRPVQALPAPAVKDTSWPLNDIDRFVLMKVEEKGLRPVAPADKRTLIRRATYDLTGLPPTPEEIADFLKDDGPEAFAKVVDRLLASPAYGERWGRHWLDVVRYSDTAGDNSDYPIPQMYRYRNWVIRSFNEDKPYDQFVREQLAGDLMPAAGEEDRRDRVVATGYLANARRFGSYEDARYPWHLTVEDTIDNFGRTFLGLTINCARCHDHKFDPITAEDYYALYGFFSSTRYPWPGIELDKVPRDLVPLVPAAQAEAVETERRQQLADLDAAVKKAEGEKAAADKALQEAAKAPEEERKEKVDEATRRVEAAKKAVAAARKQREDLARKPLPFPTAYAVAEGKTEGRKKVGNACVQIKGDPERLGPEVPRRFPTVLGGQALPPDVKGSGRLELATWVTDPANPLTARVMVNRIWHYHFGKGLVPTPSDFGRQGRPPTHPELLDYLAAYFTASQGPKSPAWGVKKMHRLLMLSRTYQLSAAEDADDLKRDAGNDYLWRFARRRLDGESIRDTLLAVSGALDRTPGGEHPFPDPPTWDFTQHKPFKAVYETNRRSVYLMTQRIQRHPFLALFDGADANAGTPSRATSTTALQALYLMNDPFVHEQARKFAARLLAERQEDAGRVERAYLLAFGRPPDAEEQAAAKEYLGRVRDKLAASGVPAEQRAARAWESFARALFLSNEFVYVN
jgi:hypothetical protein